MSLFSLFRRKKKKVINTIPVDKTYEYFKDDLVSIELHSAEDFTQDELDFYISALKLCLHVINSLDFKLAVTSEQNMVLTKGSGNVPLSPWEIYDLFMSGKTVLDPTADKDIDVTVCLYYENNGVIGYTYPSSLGTWLNRKFFNNQSTIVGNMIHEYMHKCGFSHSFYNPEKMSVPYFYGNVAERIARSVLNGKQLTKIRKAS